MIKWMYYSSVIYSRASSSRTACALILIFINSIRNKIHELKPIITKLQPVLFTVAETKLDNSFYDSQFAVTNYRILRQDGSSSSSGGLVSYVRCDIPCRRVPTLETKVVGMIAVELRIKNTNLNGWSYKHTNLPALVIFQRKMILNQLGDLNCDILCEKGRPLQRIMDIYSLTNICHVYFTAWPKLNRRLLD